MIRVNLLKKRCGIRIFPSIWSTPNKMTMMSSLPPKNLPIGTLSCLYSHQKVVTASYSMSTLNSTSKNMTLTKLISNKIKAYLELAKYKLSALVVVTSGAGFICAGTIW
jgi:hypothetical protein